MRFNSSIKGKVANTTPESASGIHSLNNVNVALQNNGWFVPYLYPFQVDEVLPFTVSRTLNNSASGNDHSTGPTQTQVRNWLSGTSNGGPNWSYTNYVDVPVQGYQRWTVGQQGVYEITARGAGGGGTDSNPSFHDGRGQIAKGRFSLSVGDVLIIVVGQGAPDFVGDHCNGAGGGSFVAFGSNYTTAVPLLVGAGSSGDTSDGGGNNPSITSTSRTVTDPSGNNHTGLTTTPVSFNANNFGTWGYSHNPVGASDKTVGGGFWGSSPTAGQVNQHGETFSEGLVGGTRSNNTAGYGGFGGGSGGFDEKGNSAGGFTTGESHDGPGSAAGGWINTGHSKFVSSSATGFSLKPVAQNSSTSNVWQTTDFTSDAQLNGSVIVKRIS